MRILGIDPGIAIVGWGVVEQKGNSFCPLDYGAIQTPAKMQISYRLEMIYSQLNEIIDKYSPDMLAIEQLFWNTNQKTAIAVSQARGVILLCARQKGLDISEYTPLQVKQAVVGYGRADKKQVIAMVSALLRLKNLPKFDDTADALAVALCGGHCANSRLAFTSR
ncbi:MAG: crossover junction endodeoxyribonuclease RuvC [Clostridiales bacterium]|nr:crossover junction endodeoxyribonuclease RuvC [Clostridiales bacterium]